MRDRRRQAARAARGGQWAGAVPGARGSGRARVGPGVGGLGGRLPRAQAGRARRLRPREGGAGRPTWARSGAVGPGLARPRRRGSALRAAASRAQAAASARPPSCSGSPRGALPRGDASSRAPARPDGGAFLPPACGAERNRKGSSGVCQSRRGVGTVPGVPQPEQ